MTKINKLGKSTFVIAILSFLLVAVLAFGGTYAYFSDRASAVTGSIKTGHLNIETVTGEDTDGVDGATLQAVGTIAQPNQVIFNDETVTATVKSNIAYYTRVRFNVKLTGMDGHVHHKNVGDTTEGNTKCADYVANATDILTVTIANGGKSGSTGTKWQTSSNSDAITAGQDIIYYQLAPTLAKDGVDNYDTASGKGTEQFSFTIQVKDWVGNNGDVKTDGADAYDNRAEGCDYWMDVNVEVQVIVEVLQADFLLAENGENNGNVINANSAQPFADGATAAQKWEAALGKKQTQGS